MTFLFSSLNSKFISPRFFRQSNKVESESIHFTLKLLHFALCLASLTRRGLEISVMCSGSEPCLRQSEAPLASFLMWLEARAASSLGT